MRNTIEARFYPAMRRPESSQGRAIFEYEPRATPSVASFAAVCLNYVL